MSVEKLPPEPTDPNHLAMWQALVDLHRKISEISEAIDRIKSDVEWLANRVD